MRPRLSLCMIVRDSARTLAACLEGIRPWVDEIVVVDTGSQDQTPQIALQFGARLHRFAWCDDFSAARNESLRHAQGEWVFWMDSDDTIDAENGRRLRELVERADESSAVAYIMQVHCPGPAANHDVTVVDHVKLFRNLPELRFEGRIHEQVLPAIRRQGGAVAWTDLFVTHSGADLSEEGKRRKRTRDLRLIRLDLEDRPEHPFVLFNLGMTLADGADYAGAIEALTRCLAVSQAHESHVRKAHALLVNAYVQTDRAEAAWEACVRGLADYPQDAELLFRRGMVAHLRGSLADAEASYLAVLEVPRERHFTSRDRGISGFKARHNLAVVYLDQGRPELAETQWRRALEQVPDYGPSWRGLGETMLKLGRSQTALRIGRRIGQHPPLERLGLVVQARALDRLGWTEQARQILREAIDRWPHDLEPLESLCRMLFESGDSAETEAALRTLMDRAPQDGAARHNLGTLCLAQGRAPEAVEAYRASLRVRPRSAATWLNLGYALSACGDEQGAQQAWSEAADYSTEDSPLGPYLHALTPLSHPGGSNGRQPSAPETRTVPSPA